MAVTKVAQPEPFKQISETEYEVQVNSRTKLIKVPFDKVSKIFQAFIAGGGIIDPVTGQVQTDILSLIAGFKDVGDILLTEFDDTPNNAGKVVEQGNCSQLSTKEVIALFQLATHLVQSFIQELSQIQPSQTSTPSETPEEK